MDHNLLKGLKSGKFNESEEQQDEESCIPSLNNQGKITSFGITAIIGLFIQLFSFGGEHGDFSFWYCIGNFILLAGSGILVKPSLQIKNLPEKRRKEYILVYIGAVILTLFINSALKSSLLSFIAFVLGALAFTFYVATYLPFLQDILKKIFGSIWKFD